MVQKNKRAEPYPCRNWAVNERGYCGVHYATEVERELKAERAASARELLLAGIDAWIAAEPERQQELLDWLAERQEYEDPPSSATHGAA